MATRGHMSAKRATTTTYWTRRYVFACNHTTDRYYPVKDTPAVSAAGSNGQPKGKSLPLLLPLRVGRDCSACLRRVVLDRVQTKATAVRACFDALCARIDRSPKTLDDDLDRPLLVGGDDVDNVDNDDHEVWPEQPPTLESLTRFYVSQAATKDVEIDSNSDSYSTVIGTTTSDHPKGKLSDRIRSLREDLERRKQAWDRSPKSSKMEDANEVSV